MDIVLRATFAYLFILFMMRVVGRRELSSMEPSDVILLVVIGDLIQNGVTQADDSVTGIALGAGTIAVLAAATSYLTFRFKRVHTIVEGDPVILVQNGEVIEKNIRGERLTMNEVMEQARSQQVESLDEIKWAVLESNGAISVIPKQ